MQSMSPHPKPCVSLFCIVGGFAFENYEFIISKIFLKEHLEEEKKLMVLTIKTALLQKPHPLLSALGVCYLAGGRLVREVRRVTVLESVQPGQVPIPFSTSFAFIVKSN